MTGPAITAPPVVLTVGQAIEAVLVGDLADFQLFDGPSELQAYAPKSVTVGGRWDPDLEAYTGDQTVTVTLEELGAGRRVRETTAVACMAYAGSGDPTMAPHRAVLGQLLTAIRTALRAITAVDGASAQARMTDQQWAQVLDENGGGVMCMFTVTVAVLP